MNGLEVRARMSSLFTKPHLQLFFTHLSHSINTNTNTNSVITQSQAERNNPSSRSTAMTKTTTADQKANKDLTPEERKAKRDFKKQYREEQKRRRLESRLRHALHRKDAVVERQMREALGNHHYLVNQEVGNDDARTFVKKMAQALQQKQPTSQGASKKQIQTEQARQLLKHMTKGTQKKGMFDNEDALWGYARQKFIERAMLVCDSFCNLQQLEDTNRKNILWSSLLDIKTVCSIGCGPGNDALGVLAFLRTQHIPKLPHVICLDYVMDEWQTVLKPLREIMVGPHFGTMSLESCDVTQSLSDGPNERAKSLLHDVNLYLFSYLLTETRGKWEPFLRDLLQHAQPGALFYFAEPTPWQLHPLLKFDEMETVWLDSSMNSPQSQPTDKRFGPAVLLGRKKTVPTSA
jgi:hypothetical protein